MGEVFAVTIQNLRSLPQRASASIVAIIGVAGVVAVLVAVLSMARGIEQTFNAGSNDANVVVTRSGSSSELDSGFSVEQARIIGEAPGLARESEQGLSSPEGYAMVDLTKRSTGTTANVPMRGITPAAAKVRPNFQIVEGRMFEPGRLEAIAGIGAAGQFEGLVVGQPLELGQQRWDIVGLFQASGQSVESEVWVDVPVFQSVFNRTGYSVIYATLENPDALELFETALTADPRLSINIQREADYFEAQSQVMTGLIDAVGVGIAFLMSLGAIFGALNTMYTAVADRSREIATLRALGFGRLAIIVSVLVEAVLLAFTGGLIGGLIAWALFNGFAVSTLNFSSFTQLVFAFAVTPELLVQGIVLAVIIGVVGGLTPAIRAARMPITTALREV
ncbi:MAG: ABC transporter permease [Pseudomonadota bacterium]